MFTGKNMEYAITGGAGVPRHAKQLCGLRLRLLPENGYTQDMVW
jgi:hypothetical protein